MRLLPISLALSVSLLACLRPAQADASHFLAPNIPKTKLAPGAKQAVAALARMYDARDKLKAFHVEYWEGKCGDGLDPIRVVGELQKPNKMNLRLFHGTELFAQVVSDGITETVYDPERDLAMRFPALPSFDLELPRSEPKPHARPRYAQSPFTDGSIPVPPPDAREDAGDAGNIVRNIVLYAGLQKALQGAKFLLLTTTQEEVGDVNAYLAHAKVTKKVAGPNATLNVVSLNRGTSGEIKTLNLGVLLVANTQDEPFYQFICDPQSGLPTEFYSGVAICDIAGKPLAERVYKDFEGMKIEPIAIPYSDAVFAWTPPAKSRLNEMSEPDSNTLDPTPKPRLIEPVQER
jgi:hypothetical protein